MNQSWKQHSTNQQLYSYLFPISQSIQIRGESYIAQCWKIKDHFISNVLPRTQTHSHNNVGSLVKKITFIRSGGNTECYLEDLPKVIAYRDWWWKRVKETRAPCTLWLWSFCFLYYIILFYIITAKLVKSYFEKSYTIITDVISNH